MSERRERRGQVEKHDPNDPVDLFALRDALSMAPDSEVRAIALRRLNVAGARRLVAYVRDATLDASPRVREAAFVALARARDEASLARAEAACTADPSFRVRRMALLFAATTFGPAALRALAIAGDDPFWRVRVAARRAGASLDASVDVARAAPADIEAAPAIAAVADADPAVVTARLLGIRSQLVPRELVPALAHSHQALRRLAVTEIGARGDLATLEEVSRWLTDERVPYAPAAAEATLARAGARGKALAARLLERNETVPAGPLAWAIEAAARAPEWSVLAPLLAHGDARVRRAAIFVAPEAAPSPDELHAAMARGLEDDDPLTRSRAVAWLARAASRAAKALLLTLDPAADQPTFVRSVLVDLYADAGDAGAVRRFADDPHGGVRAAALLALARLDALSSGERVTLARDDDPWVRNVVLGPDRVSTAANDPDPELRARAAAALARDGAEGAIAALLRLARDADFGVRSIAVDALERRLDRVRELLDSGVLADPEQLAAHTLLRLSGAAAGARAESPPDPGGARAAPASAELSAHLALLDDVIADRPPALRVTPYERPEPPPPRALPPRRALGNTGLSVHPFGLSGAHGLDARDFACAHERGVDLYFWEPSHRELARFLRGHRPAVVVAGTYHADAESIEKDVTRALRALRRDALDVLLTFWTRSPARIEMTREVLRRLVERGLVRAVGISTHDRALARQAATEGLDVVMVRHSAAHRGAEEHVFPHAIACGTGVLTFSSLCYGRMLHKTPAEVSGPVTAADCYRYSISQPGVSACVAAPRRRSELLEDLEVMDRPDLVLDRMAELRAHGDHVYARSKAWTAETWAVAEHPPPAREAERLADWIDTPESLSQTLW